MATQSPPSEKLLTAADVAELIGVAPGLLAEWRSRRVGPPFLKLSHKVVRYDPATVRKWMAARQVSGVRS